MPTSISASLPTRWNRKRFMGIPNVKTPATWECTTYQVKILERVIANWMTDDQPESALELRLRGRTWSLALERLQSIHAIDVNTAGNYELTLFGLTAAVALDAKGTRSIWAACQKVFTLAKAVFRKSPSVPEMPYEEFRAMSGLSDHLMTRALNILHYGSAGVSVNERTGKNPTVVAYESILRYENLWEYVSMFVNPARSGVRDLTGDLSSLAAACHFDETLEVVHNGSDLVRKAIANINGDPAGAITAARSLVEASMKWVLHDSDVDFSAASSPAQLLKKCAAHIGFDDGHAKRETGIGQMLSGMETVLHGLAKMRDELGDAHGRRPGTPSPTRRQARLAVGLAITLSSFLVEAREAHKAH